MKQLLLLSMLSGLTACANSYSNSPYPDPRNARLNTEAPAVIYKNGNWYSETSAGPIFETKDTYSKNGILVSDKPMDAKIVDLGGKFIIPPFGEAHNHSVEGEWTKYAAEKYISQGTFYYKNPNNLARVANPMRDFWGRPDTLDVIFSHGGISINGGHPNRLYRNLADTYRMELDEIEGQAYFHAQTIAQLREKWPDIVAGKPDFIKLYLMRHNTDRSEGLSAEVFREAVSLAKKSGLRTTVHLESIEDLRVALDAGADEMAHIVSRKPDTVLEANAIIPDDLVAQIVRQNFVTVTTTYVQALAYKDEPAKLKPIQKVQGQNLRKLYDAGAPIAIGTDRFVETTVDEIKTLQDIGTLTDAELLGLWINTPSVSIYSERAIGKLIPGFEASFLALNCNPVENLDCAQDIHLGVKQGVTLIE